MRRIAALSLLVACTGIPAEQQAPPAAVEVAPVSPEPTPTPARVVPVSGTLPIGGGEFGTAGPTIVRAVDPGERWVALCQARKDTDGDGKIEIEIGHHGSVHGDAMEPYLVLGGGEGTRVDALAGHSEDGRWLAIVREGKVELVDATTGDTFALKDADAQPDGRPGTWHRAAVFAGQRLLYVRQVAGKDDVLVVRELADHGERELPVPGRLWRIAHGADRIARLSVLSRDQTFPALKTTLSGGECVGPAMSWSSYGDDGPKPSEHWIDLETGKLLAAEHGQVAVGATIVRTPPDGSLYFDNEQIASPSCRVQLLAVLREPARVIAICGEKKAARIVLLGKGLRTELAAIDRETDHYGDFHEALPAAPGVVCDAGLHCVATATSKPVDLKGGVAEYAWGNRIYVVHPTMTSREHEIIDVVAGTRTPIAADDLQMVGGRFVVDYSDNLVDLEAGTILGKVPGAVRVSAKGRALVGAGELQGPMRWRAP